MGNYTLGLYEKAMPMELSWEEKLEAAKEAGYDFVEISIDETDEKLKRLDMSEKAREELRRLMKETKMPIGTMCLSGHRRYPLGSSNPQTQKRGMELMEKSVALAADLGVRIIQLAGYDVYYEDSTGETRQRFEQSLHRAAHLAAKEGILLGFETMETELMNTVEKAMDYVKRINSPYLQIYPDAGNITNAAVTYGKDVVEDLRKGEGHILAVHLKETVPGKFREIPYGTGHVDFRKITEAAWEMGVRRFVTEFWHTGNPAWKNELREAVTMMRGIIDLSNRTGKTCSRYGD